MPRPVMWKWKRRLALAAACDNVVIAGLICPQGLWPLSLLTEGTVVPL